ncbi:MAG: hypothetical protein HY774_21910 [Acidobacteria bacterium]|nr:hypothetical protein [Acidobacteriota bacterium]
MARVTLRRYHESGAAGERQRHLVEIRFVETASTKPVTQKRAGQIITREFPAFHSIGRTIVIKTEDGYWASRALQPTPGCSFHYIWEHVYLTEDQ